MQIKGGGISHANNQKKAHMAILISDKVDSRAKKIIIERDMG